MYRKESIKSSSYIFLKTRGSGQQDDLSLLVYSFQIVKWLILGYEFEKNLCNQKKSNNNQTIKVSRAS